MIISERGWLANGHQKLLEQPLETLTLLVVRWLIPLRVHFLLNLETMHFLNGLGVLDTFFIVLKMKIKICRAHELHLWVKCQSYVHFCRSPVFRFFCLSILTLYCNLTMINMNMKLKYYLCVYIHSRVS